jgi:hypothetical protein
MQVQGKQGDRKRIQSGRSVKTEGCRDRGIREGERGGEENRRMVDGY